MKKAPTKRHRDELREEYVFSYAESRPNRFATQVVPGAIAVVIDPDVALVFDSSESVNQFLRSAITAMPEKRRKKKAVSALRVSRPRR